MADRLYTIVGQRPTTDLDAFGNVYEVIEISWQGPNAILGKEKIPAALFTADYVDSVIRAKLITHKEISELGQG